MRESGKERGGMLLSEAGTGKTLCMLKLIEASKMVTLLVVPKSLMSVWENEVKKHELKIKVKRLYGKTSNEEIGETGDRKGVKPPTEGEEPVLYITTYGTLVSKYDKGQTIGCRQGVQSSLQGIRVVLDEAHYIKNRNAKVAKAVLEL